MLIIFLHFSCCCCCCGTQILSNKKQWSKKRGKNAKFTYKSEMFSARENVFQIFSSCIWITYCPDKPFLLFHLLLLPTVAHYIYVCKCAENTRIMLCDVFMQCFVSETSLPNTRLHGAKDSMNIILKWNKEKKNEIIIW